MKPESRKDDVLTQKVGDELVIYDERSHEAHRLNPTVAVVWQMADGTRSMGDLASSLRRSIVPPAGETVQTVDSETSEELVRLALRELDRVGLLVPGLPVLGEPLTRREMIGVAAALVPVIASVVAPTPAMAQTTCFLPPTTWTPFNGTYIGNGIPIAPTCGFVNGPVTVSLMLGNNGVGPLVISHSGVTFSGVATAGTIPMNCAFSVTAGLIGGTFGGDTRLTFRGNSLGPFFVSGTQQIVVPGCGVTPFSINARR